MELHSHTEVDEIEGIDDNSSPDGTSPYPLDDVMVRRSTRTVAEVKKRIEQGRYVMAPDFQRDFVWDKQKQSKLIESCVMRIPLPVFYVAEAEDGRITVVDGLQRLSTFLAFLNNKLKLTKLGKNSPLNGKTFKELPVNLQERVEDTQLTLYILDRKAPEAARLDIFDRVNSGVALSRQQMRNALHNGQATRWLADMAESKEFLEATGGSLSKKTMRDREAINRFLAFYQNGWENYVSGDMDMFLAETLKDVNNMDKKELEEISRNFKVSMKINSYLFGDHAFRKSMAEKSKYASRTVINISLFDVMSYTMSDFELKTAKSYKGEMSRCVVNLLRNDEFIQSITYSTNSKSAVRKRFKMIEEEFEKYYE